jgi:hypothetical protein
LRQHEIEIKNNPGTSLDRAIIHRHRDLVLSGKKLLNLTELLLRYGELSTMTKPEVEDLVNHGIRDGELREEDCRPKFKR